MAIVASTIVFGVGLYGLRFGFGSHGDSRAIFEASVAAIANGHYAPSRSYGVPLYEYAAAILQPLGGLWLVNLFSLALSLSSLAIFAGLLGRLNNATPSVKSWALAGFALNPLLLINASSPTEWAQALFFLVGAIAGVEAWLRTKSLSSIVAYGLCICGIVLSRPDFAVVCLALGVAVLWEIKLARRASIPFVAVTILAGATTAAVYMALNGGPSFFLRAGEMVGDQIGLRRLFVAAAGVLDLFGPAACAAIAIGFGRLLLTRGDGRGLSFFEKFALLTWPILFARVALLPDKLEYLFPLIPITLLAFASRRQPVVLIAVVAGSLMLNSLFTVSLFDRPGTSDKVVAGVHLNKSAVMQDWDARIAQARALDAGFQAHVVDAVYGPNAQARTLQFKNFAPGYTDERNNLILSKDEVYKMDNPRFTDTRYQRPSYGRIYICDRTFIADNVGWRVLQRPPRYADFDHGDTLGCRAE